MYGSWLTGQKQGNTYQQVAKEFFDSFWSPCRQSIANFPNAHSTLTCTLLIAWLKSWCRGEVPRCVLIHHRRGLHKLHLARHRGCGTVAVLLTNHCLLAWMHHAVYLWVAQTWTMSPLEVMWDWKGKGMLKFNNHHLLEQAELCTNAHSIPET